MTSDIPSIESLLSLIAKVKSRYYRLIILTGPVGSGKTKVLRLVSEKTGAPIVNVNLEVSRNLLSMTERQRSVCISRVVEQLVEAAGNDVVLLDNIEILFDRSLELNPLELLKKLSRNRTIVSTWGGRAEGRELVYADSGHREYRRYPIEDFEVVEIETGL